MKIGPMVTPLPRRRPQKLACEVASLDALSNGRVVFGVGLGWPPKEYSAFGEEVDIGVRAQKLEESLEILKGLWTGKEFSFSGEHYVVKEFQLHPTPVQKPRVPIWVAGMWPKKNPFRRAAQYEGVIPLGTRDPTEFVNMKQYTETYRKRKGDYDWVCSLTYPAKKKRAELLSEFEHAGATWYLESWGTIPIEKQRKRVARGPPS
jgi:alkanesulfonate monooxygenase SsuD/methylene tetrahydromethanopterin reductase-like flavin-dependent oxidoreductase (luciferase family)